MELILWRHADAGEGPPDADNDLSAEGEKQAAKVAAWLTTRMRADTRILVSPERRTQQTASALNLPFETLKSLNTRAIAPDILHAAAWPHGDRDVLIVGHQPTLGEAAAVLLLNESQPMLMRKGSLWWFSFRERDNFESTFVRAVVTPELLD